MNKTVSAMFLGVALLGSAAHANKFLPPDQQEKAMVGVQLPPALRPEAGSWPGYRPGESRALPPNVPDVPTLPGAASGSTGRNEVPVRFIGTFNGKQLYRGADTYHFDSKKRTPPVLVEQPVASVEQPPADKPAASVK